MVNGKEIKKSYCVEEIGFTARARRLRIAFESQVQCNSCRAINCYEMVNEKCVEEMGSE